jgi:hypothetical protein
MDEEVGFPSERKSSPMKDGKIETERDGRAKAGQVAPFRPIGVIRSSIKERNEAPKQGHSST